MWRQMTEKFPNTPTEMDLLLVISGSHLRMGS